MRLRLSNGYSFCVEFRAQNAAEFRREFRRSALEYFAKTGKFSAAQLHVATDGGEWLSAHYPRSNAPYYVTFGKLERAKWVDLVRSNQRGTWFEYELTGLTAWVNDQ